jgi:hypothetical protein
LDLARACDVSEPTPSQNKQGSVAKSFLDRLRSMMAGWTAMDWIAVALSCAALLGYSYLRTRAVGGCDSFAYFADSLALRGVRFGPMGGLDPLENPSVVPLCHVSLGRHVVPFFLPGFPALIALFGMMRADFWVTPVLGALSVALVYLSAREEAHPSIAVALSAVWAVCPIVVWGSTRMMSDLPAATVLLASYLFAKRSAGLCSGIALALAVAIRPASLLVGPIFWLRARRQGSGRRFFVGLTLGLLLLGAFLAGRFGSPFDAVYRRNLAELAPSLYGEQLAFLGLGVLRDLGPVALLAGVGVMAKARVSLGLALWGVAFFFFHALWRHPFDAWWWQRFVLSSLPAWMLLAAMGCGELERRLGARRRGLVRACVIAMLVATAMMGAWQSRARGLFVPGFDRGYRDDAETVARLVPGDALVGALNFSGPLRLYAGLETFDYTHPQGLSLARRELSLGRSIFLVAEPWLLASEPARTRWTQMFRLRKLARLSQWPGLFLIELESADGQAFPRRARVDLGHESARADLLDGWSGDERNLTKTFVWAMGETAAVRLRLDPGTPYVLSFKAVPFRGVEEQCVEVSVEETVLGRRCLESVEAVYHLDASFVPREAQTVVRFSFTGAASPASIRMSSDERLLAVAFDWIQARPVPRDQSDI